jgi:hypothetical protein
VVEIRIPLEVMGYPETITFDWMNVGLDWTGFESIGSYELKLPARVPIATITPQPSPVATAVSLPTGSPSPALVESGDDRSPLSIWSLLGAGGLTMVLLLFWLLRRQQKP